MVAILKPSGARVEPEARQRGVWRFVALTAPTGIALIAELPERSGMVGANPPLSLSGPRCGSTPT